MNKPHQKQRKLRILNIEDNPDDSDLMRMKISREGIEHETVRIETKEDFVAALEQGDFDIILSDYSLPSFDGLSALEIAREKYPEIPFLFVSGAIGEEFAIETLKRGATDYILKDRLSKLAPAINRALKEAEERVARKRAEKELKRSYEELERRIEERTEELRMTNELLQAEIVERKPTEQDREKLILELRDALAKIKTLGGLLPMCAWCKRIRDDKGYWKRVETYIREHSHASFTHGICPECLKRVSPEAYDELMKSNSKLPGEGGKDNKTDVEQ